MKKNFTFLSLIIIPILGLNIDASLNKTSLANLLTYSVCDKPILYKVDRVDPKFDLSKDNFIEDANQAAQIWNKILGKKLFVYDTQGSLSINLIYDERQSLTSKVNQLENTVKSEQQTLKPEIKEYQNLAADFKQKISALNKEIEYWNSKGGAPPDEYNKIIQQQQELKEQANRLNTMAQNLNVSTNNYNSQVSELNQTISTLDNALQEKPEEGVFKYPENVIEVYFNISSQELIHTLAHELGHSIGLQHSTNSKAIMYSKTNQSLILSPDDISALEKLCQRHSIFELLQYYFNLILSRYKIKS